MLENGEYKHLYELWCKMHKILKYLSSIYWISRMAYYKPFLEGQQIPYQSNILKEVKITQAARQHLFSLTQNLVMDL